MKALVVLLALALTGCAIGVAMTDAEALACKASGCTVWTDAELQLLIRKIHKDGYLAGVQSL